MFPDWVMIVVASGNRFLVTAEWQTQPHCWMDRPTLCSYVIEISNGQSNRDQWGRRAELLTRHSEWQHLYAMHRYFKSTSLSVMIEFVEFHTGLTAS